VAAIMYPAILRRRFFGDNIEPLLTLPFSGNQQRPWSQGFHLPDLIECNRTQPPLGKSATSFILAVASNDLGYDVAPKYER